MYTFKITEHSKKLGLISLYLEQYPDSEYLLIPGEFDEKYIRLISNSENFNINLVDYYNFFQVENFSYISVKNAIIKSIISCSLVFSAKKCWSEIIPISSQA